MPSTPAAINAAFAAGYNSRDVQALAALYEQDAADMVMATVAGTPLSHDGVVAAQRGQWEEFYREVREHPVPRTYDPLLAPDVDVRDPLGTGAGWGEWTSEERGAISLGVRATIVGLVATHDIALLDIDFCNPAESPDHCPPQATLVHQLKNERSHELRGHSPGENSQHDRTGLS